MPGRPHGQAKLIVPDPAAGFLRRQRLLDFLHAHIDRKLVLVAAAAGYGKTSLLADFGRDTDFAVAWYSLDAADHDLVHLLAGLVASLRRPFPQFGTALSAVLADPAGRDLNPEQLAAALTHEIEAAIDDYFVLVLDDYHLVDSAPAVQQFFAGLLRGLPEQAHLLVASRVIPDLPIVSLVARQEIAALGENQLGFKPAEIQALLHLRHGISVPAAEAESLAAHTEGWVMGILLSAQLMWQNMVATWLRAQQASEPIYDYLADEVLAGLPGPLRTFLLETSILPDLEPATCDAILERSDSAEMLDWAEVQRLFVTGIGDERQSRTFRYHHLFREFLLNQLRQSDPERHRALHRRAGDWYAAEGWAETAITFYLAAGEVPQAVVLAEANAEAFFYSGRHDTLRAWRGQLGSAAGELPSLHLHLAKIDTDAGSFKEAGQALDQAEAGSARRNDARGLVSVAVQRSLLLYRQGRYAEALAIANRAAAEADAQGYDLQAGNAWRYAGLSQFALRQLPAAQSALEASVAVFERIRRAYDLAWALLDLSRVLRAAGQTARSAQAQRQALDLWREMGSVGPMAAALNNIGLDQHLLGQYQPAMATYAEALKAARQAGLALVESAVLAGRGDLLADLGDLRQAGEAYHRALDLAESKREIGLVRYLYLAFARLDRWSGNLLGALEWLRRAELVPVAAQVESVGLNPHALHGMALLDMGQTAEAQALLAAACEELEAAGAAGELAHALLGLGRARFLAGDSPGAFDALRRAFRLTEEVGYDQMLVSEAEWARDALEAARQPDDLRARADSILARSQSARNLVKHAEAAPASAGAQTTLILQALGLSRVLRDGVEIPRTEAASHPRELLFFVADRAPVDREALLAAFWPQMPAARAIANFHQTLYRLRRALKTEAIVFKDNQYWLAPPALLQLDYDVRRFEQRARAALAMPAGGLDRIASLEAARDLYTGEYLADLAVEWARPRREALSDLFVDVLRAYADEMMGLARYAEARRTLARALEIEPLRDDLHEGMLSCLAALGRRHEVVEHYQNYRALLRSELGLDPPASARNLYARLLQ